MARTRDQLLEALHTRLNGAKFVMTSYESIHRETIAEIIDQLEADKKCEDAQSRLRKGLRFLSRLEEGLEADIDGMTDNDLLVLYLNNLHNILQGADR